MMGNLFRGFFVPWIKILSTITKQLVLIEESRDILKFIERKEREKNFPFMCPKCSGLMKLSKEDPFDGICYHCNTLCMELFFGAQKLFKIDDGSIIWWVSAETKEGAVQEVLEFELAAGCDLVKEGYWEKRYLEFADIISYKRANKLDFTDDYERVSSIWEEFARDFSTRVIACSEW